MSFEWGAPCQVDPNWKSTHSHYRCVLGHGVPRSQENENLTYKRTQLRTIVRGRGGEVRMMVATQPNWGNYFYQPRRPKSSRSATGLYIRLGFDRPWATQNSFTFGSPMDFLKKVLGKCDVVRLTSRVDYRGMFSSPMPRAQKMFTWFTCSGVLTCLDEYHPRADRGTCKRSSDKPLWRCVHPW